MWSIGFRVVTASIVTGEFTVAPFAGEEMQTCPDEVVPGFGGGSIAGAGNDAVPVIGPCFSANVTVGQVLLPPPVPGGAGVGFGFAGMECELAPQAENKTASATEQNNR